MPRLPRCDLKAPTSILRSNDWGQGYRLTEPSPTYDGTAESIHSVIRWLGVERGGRWRPKPGTTYCNVYATDLAHACDAYLPRVWWNPRSEASLTAGGKVDVAYGTTVMELSANALFRWLTSPHSESHGWYRTDSFTAAQQAANCGHVVVLCCRKKVEASPGHIAVIAPETTNVTASRDEAGWVVLPVLSQAGARNQELAVATPWWESHDMAGWGVWVHQKSD